MRSNRLTMWIVVALLLGIASGYVVTAQFGASSARFAEIVELLPTAFLRLIKMIIAPLVFAP
ncbi:cation:dicarboxylate symporter family transporter, partial [Salmonella enterica]|uniref:cation:dicarboxylate symporter family transporter n=1 Tax=Salmonella enterica TaxID=28901 RepID=UPI003298324E